MSSKIVRAIDIGYGNVKLTLSNYENGQFDTMHFPSEAIPVNPLDEDIGGSFVTKKNIKTINVCNKTFKVGVDSLLIDQDNVHRNLHDDYINQKSYMALYLGALSYMNLEHIDILVVGLPVRLMSRKEKELKSMLEGTHQIADNKSVTVERVKVIHQPLGGFLNFSKSTGTQSNFLNSTNLIIDVGYYTMDWLVSKGMKPIEKRCSGNRYGASKILDLILKSVQDDKTLNTSIDSINYIDEAILKGRLKIRGKEYPIDKYIQSADFMIDEAIRDLTTNLKSIDDIENIILSGGGAHFYQKAIEKEFSDFTVLMDSDSIFSNVNGFQIVGEMIAMALNKKVA